jgi:hypothetical protein
MSTTLHAFPKKPLPVRLHDHESSNGYDDAMLVVSNLMFLITLGMLSKVHIPEKLSKRSFHVPSHSYTGHGIELDLGHERKRVPDLQGLAHHTCAQTPNPP